VANRLQSVRNPTSIVLIMLIAVALICAGLLGGELYWRHRAQRMLTAMVECMVDDDASVSIATTPPLLLQSIEGNYTEINDRDRRQASPCRQGHESRRRHQGLTPAGQWSFGCTDRVAHCDH
jgi:hypothetical protein